MTDDKKSILKKARKLHNETTMKSIEDISFACKRLGFKADITIAIELEHDDLPDSVLLHMTGNKNDQTTRIFTKSIVAMLEAFSTQDPFEDLSLMSVLAKNGTLDKLKVMNEKMDFLNAIAATAKDMISKHASEEEVYAQIMSNMECDEDNMQ